MIQIPLLEHLSCIVHSTEYLRTGFSLTRHSFPILLMLTPSPLLLTK